MVRKTLARAITHHRAIDDQKGLITAVETTPGSVTENRKLLEIAQHETHTGRAAEIVMGDHKYGTQDNFVACQERGLTTHLGDANKGQDHHEAQGIFPESAFHYDPLSDTYRCRAGQTLKPRRVHPCATPWSIRQGRESVRTVFCADNAPERS